MIIVCELRDCLGCMSKEYCCRSIQVRFHSVLKACVVNIFSSKLYRNMGTIPKTLSLRISDKTSSTHPQAVLKLFPLWHHHITQASHSAIVKHHPWTKKKTNHPRAPSRSTLKIYSQILQCNFIESHPWHPQGFIYAWIALWQNSVCAHNLPTHMAAASYSEKT